MRVKQDTHDELQSFRNKNDGSELDLLIAQKRQNCVSHMSR